METFLTAICILLAPLRLRVIPYLRFAKGEANIFTPRRKGAKLVKDVNRQINILT